MSRGLWRLEAESKEPGSEARTGQVLRPAHFLQLATSWKGPHQKAAVLGQSTGNVGRDTYRGESRTDMAFVATCREQPPLMDGWMRHVLEDGRSLSAPHLKAQFKKSCLQVGDEQSVSQSVSQSGLVVLLLAVVLQVISVCSKLSDQALSDRSSACRRRAHACMHAPRPPTRH